MRIELFDGVGDKEGEAEIQDMRSFPLVVCVSTMVDGVRTPCFYVQKVDKPSCNAYVPLVITDAVLV